jgi:hypothetical protein
MTKYSDFEITQLTKLVTNGESYISTLGLTEDIPVYVDFVEGRQWARKSAPGTEWLPRFVLNITKMIVRNKKSGILSSPVKLLFKGEREDDKVQLFNDFVEYIQKEMRQEDLDDKAVWDGVVKGTGVWYYYWDENAKGLDSSYTGGVRGQNIDVLNLFVANPQIKDIQKQEWVIIKSREREEAIKQIANNPEEIQENDDDKSYYTNKLEQDDSKLVTVYTMFFRENGEVYVVQFTDKTIIDKARPLTPEIEGESKTERTKTFKFTRYPIVVWDYETRENSCYGRGEVEDVIPAQKEINFTYSMMLKNIQDNAWNKWLVKSANRDVEITNTPGEVLKDQYQGNADGIKPVQTQMFSSFPATLIADILEKVRTVTGSTEVMSGEIPSANMSGTAIAQLQSAAERPIEDIRKRFWRAKEEQGRVLEQFFRVFYVGEMAKPFYRTVEAGGQKIRELADFDGQNYVDVDFDVVVEAGAGTKWSEISIIQSLESMLAKGVISVESFIQAYPNSIMPNKKELLDAVSLNKQGLEAQLQQALQQLEQQKEAIAGVKALLDERQQLKEKLAVLSGAYLEAVNQNNATNKALQEAIVDAQTMAQMLGGQNEMSKMQD